MASPPILGCAKALLQLRVTEPAFEFGGKAIISRDENKGCCCTRESGTLQGFEAELTNSAVGVR
jgi:hypothetical protein